MRWSSKTKRLVLDKREVDALERARDLLKDIGEHTQGTTAEAAAKAVVGIGAVQDVLVKGEAPAQETSA
jgi:hypothetical protein